MNVATIRGTTNRNARGSSHDRRARREKLYQANAVTDEYGDYVTCQLELSPECEVVLSIDTLTVDRVVPSIDGGTYQWDNCRLACAPCNSYQGGQLAAQRRMRRKAE